jgi:hypothetical protein
MLTVDSPAISADTVRLSGWPLTSVTGGVERGASRWQPAECVTYCRVVDPIP